jgi:hypothetical protein
VPRAQQSLPTRVPAPLFSPFLRLVYPYQGYLRLSLSSDIQELGYMTSGTSDIEGQVSSTFDSSIPLPGRVTDTHKPEALDLPAELWHRVSYMISRCEYSRHLLPMLLVCRSWKVCGTPLYLRESGKSLSGLPPSDRGSRSLPFTMKFRSQRTESWNSSLPVFWQVVMKMDTLSGCGSTYST